MILRRLLPLALLLAWTALPALADGIKTAGADGKAKTEAAAKKTESKPKAKTKAKGKAQKKAAESKYRTRVLSDNTVSHYRFDANADPLGGKKKASEAKAKKSAPDTEAGKPTGKCAEDSDSCDERPSEADAL